MDREIVFLYELDFPHREEHFQDISEVGNQLDVLYAFYKVYQTLFLENQDIVISYNQLVETRFFQYWYKNDPETLLYLLKNGRIRISKYGRMVTPLEYLKKCLGENDFVFSATLENLRGTYTFKQEENMKKVMLRALESLNMSEFEKDTTELTAADGNSTSVELNWLPSDIELLREYILFVISISILIDKKMYLPEKYNELKMELGNCVDLALKLQEVSSVSSEIEELKSKLSNVSSFDINKRSHWYRLIDSNINNKEKNNKIKEIIDICYNITVESSVQGVHSIQECEDEDLKLQYFRSEYAVYYTIKNQIKEKKFYEKYKIYTEKEIWHLTIKVLNSDSDLMDKRSLEKMKPKEKKGRYKKIKKYIRKCQHSFLIVCFLVLITMLLKPIVNWIIDIIFEKMDLYIDKNFDNTSINYIEVFIKSSIVLLLVAALSSILLKIVQKFFKASITTKTASTFLFIKENMHKNSVLSHIKKNFYYPNRFKLWRMKIWRKITSHFKQNLE